MSYVSELPDKMMLFGFSLKMRFNGLHFKALGEFVSKINDQNGLFQGLLNYVGLPVYSHSIRIVSDKVTKEINKEEKEFTDIMLVMRVSCPPMTSRVLGIISNKILAIIIQNVDSKCEEIHELFKLHKYRQPYLRATAERTLCPLIEVQLMDNHWESLRKGCYEHDDAWDQIRIPHNPWGKDTHYEELNLLTWNTTDGQVGEVKHLFEHVVKGEMKLVPIDSNEAYSRKHNLTYLKACNNDLDARNKVLHELIAEGAKARWRPFATIHCGASKLIFGNAKTRVCNPY